MSSSPKKSPAYARSTISSDTSFASTRRSLTVTRSVRSVMSAHSEDADGNDDADHADEVHRARHCWDAVVVWVEVEAEARDGGSVRDDRGAHRRHRAGEERDRRHMGGSWAREAERG